MPDDCNEYQALVDRKFKPYSIGHRRMYDAPIELMRGKKRRILDVGFGIGYGLEKMIEADIIDWYLGFEPCQDAFSYVASKAYPRPVRFYGNAYCGQAAEIPFDRAFCIEVIEHCSDDEANKMLQDLRQDVSGILFLSTPPAEENSHGKFTRAQMYSMLKEAGFRDVAVLPDQWTTLYIAQ